MKGYMTVKEFALIHGVSVQHIYQQIKRKKLESRKIGSMFLVKKLDK